MTVTRLSLEAMTSTFRHEGDTLTVALIGNADLRAKKALDNLLDELHQEALRQAVKRVVIDMRELDFMNSSCFKTFVTWLNAILELPEEQRYRVRFRSNPDTLWQRRSLHALRSYALMVVKIDAS